MPADGVIELRCNGSVLGEMNRRLGSGAPTVIVPTLGLGNRARELAGAGQPLMPYHELLIAEAQDSGLRLPEHHRFDIPDTHIIDDAGYDSILEHIRQWHNIIGYRLSLLQKDRIAV